MPPPSKPSVSSPSTASASSRGGDRSLRLLHELTTRAKNNYIVLLKASEELKPTCDQILSIIGALHVIEDHREKGEISTENKRTLVDISFWLSSVFSDLEAELDDLKKGNSQEGFSPITEKELDPHAQLTAFTALIRRDRQYKIWNALEEIHGNDPPETPTSVASEWTFTELQMRGIPKDILQEEFFFINDWFKDRKEWDEEDVEPTPAQGELPDYSLESLIPVDAESQRPDYSLESLIPVDAQNQRPDYSLESLIPVDAQSQRPDYALGSLISADERPNYALGSLISADEQNKRPDYALGSLISADERNDRPDYALGSLISADERSQGPDYALGSLISADERIQPLIKPTRNLSIEHPTVSPTATKSPPPYTFDGESGKEPADAEFSGYIKKATETEAHIRLLQWKNHPEHSSSPLAWLPRENRDKYRGHDDIVHMMEPDSFTVMSYETAPRCREAMRRLGGLLRTSFAHKSDEPGLEILSEAMRALEVMEIALNKFSQLENQTAVHHLHSKLERHSDMDQLDFEISTLTAVNPSLQWPEREFSLVQKSYYRLLTYIMGFLEEMTVVFPGRTHITRPIGSLEESWNESMMAARVAWVEKQIEGWAEIDEALFRCREWHRLQANIQKESLEVLGKWAESEKVLSGSDKRDLIEFTVVAAANLPKSSFRVPKCFAKVIYYGPNRFGGAIKLGGFQTEVSEKTNNPIWNKSFMIPVALNSKYIDVEICDRIAGTEKEIAKARLSFSFLPGVEASFLSKSLIYACNEEIELPMTEISGKGKDHDPPLLRVHLVWQGRRGRLQELGLPVRPPGKMFRKDITGIPLSPNERAALTKDIYTSPEEA